MSKKRVMAYYLSETVIRAITRLAGRNDASDSSYVDKILAEHVKQAQQEGKAA